MNKIMAALQALMTLIGDVTLSEAISWLQVKENADRLLAEGHEGE